MNREIVIVDYHPRYTEQTIAVWRRSKETALGIPEMHSLESHRYYLNRILAPSHRIFVAVEKTSDTVLGMMAMDSKHISQLYIHPDHQCRGIGSALVELAQENAERLQLYTFEINLPARAFWEKHGFIEQEIGQHDNEEGLSDILCEWKREPASIAMQFAM
ncbi:GNAT family N-acetyltransferase [Enterovibrio sp. ZSDZ35]|uniref:GNAT family N-acetyltransferase n=1 Tax=Enterovibrio qingdaonensis TaxID=2899818 RepID=A0ABT5QGJ7_9GAMM|nr:GNAT family N-acetyltransferase [Enterovibrio sp. ZSDZ35]MDD1780100.1 GNAT family N-acetyltransferase [Enterovibrio sp. ZSDZ35]